MKDGNKYVESAANKEGFKITLNGNYENMLIGPTDDTERVKLKILEVYEVECYDPAKQP